MMRNVLLLALSLSLLFNVFFAVGYLRAREAARTLRPESDVARLAAEELDLDEVQTAVFAELRSAMADERETLTEGIALARQELLSELDRPSPDVDRVQALIEREAEYHRQLRMAAAERMRQFVETLSPEQRRELFRRIDPSRTAPPHLRKRLLQRFDTDGDGALSETERAEALRHFEERREQWQRKRRDLIERFDADGDGRLDEQERGTLRDWMRERRRGRGDASRPPLLDGPRGRGNGSTHRDSD
jgi:uncharacterized membrane protein